MEVGLTVSDESFLYVLLGLAVLLGDQDDGLKGTAHYIFVSDLRKRPFIA